MSFARRAAPTRPRPHREAPRAGEPEHDAGGAAGAILRLQRLAGNHAVATLLRAPSATAGRHAGRHGLPHVDPNSYVDLLNTFESLRVAAFEDHGAGLDAVPFGARLTAGQRELLESLRKAMLLLYAGGGRGGNGQAALALWDGLRPRLRAAMRLAIAVGVPAGDVDAIAAGLDELEQKLFVPAAYYDARDEARETSGVEAPDLAFEQERLEAAVEELEAAKKLEETATKVAVAGAKATGVEQVKTVTEIYELVRAPGEIAEKLAHAKKKGILGPAATGADLVAKVESAATTTAGLACEAMKGYAEGKQAVAATRELAEQWEKVAKRWGEKVDRLKVVGKAVAVIAIVADGLKLIDALAHGDLEEAASEAGDTLIDVAAAFGPEGSAPLVGAVVIGVKIEIAAMHMAAEFIRWCRDETVRQAAGSFVEACDTVAKNVALDFVGDSELALSADPRLSAIAARRLPESAAGVKQGLQFIGAQLNQGNGTRVGDHPDLVAALGPDAVRALTDWVSMPDDPLTLAQRVRDVFAGANALGRYVRAAYPTGDGKSGETKGEEAKGEE